MTTRHAILASFLVTATLGVLFIATYWSHQGKFDRAIMNSVLFIAVMAIVHWAGHKAWLSQPTGTPASAALPASVASNPRLILGVVLFGLFLFLAGIQFNKYTEMRRLAAERAALGRSFAPTMISERAGYTIALLCFGFISLLAGLKKPASKSPTGDVAA